MRDPGPQARTIKVLSSGLESPTLVSRKPTDLIMTRLWRVLRRAVTASIEDRVLTYAAALSFYSALSIPPLVVFLLWALGSISPGAEDHLRREAVSLIGEDGGVVIDSVLENADRRVSFNGISAIVSTAALIFAASGVFRQLQLTLNRLWGVRANPEGILAWVRKRLGSLAIVGLLAFLMLISLGASVVVSAAGFGLSESALVRVLNWLVSVGVFTVLFAATFRYLADVRMRWRDVWGGAAVTAVLFALGKSAIGLYLARRGVGSDYGAAGSAIVMLVWAYFSSAILFVGAEITQAWIETSGRRLEPTENAEWLNEPD